MVEELVSVVIPAFNPDGFFEVVGDAVGILLGDFVATGDITATSKALGIVVGAGVGIAVGFELGFTVGWKDGMTVGRLDGL